MTPGEGERFRAADCEGGECPGARAFQRAAGGPLRCRPCLTLMFLTYYDPDDWPTFMLERAR